MISKPPTPVKVECPHCNKLFFDGVIKSHIALCKKKAEKAEKYEMMKTWAKNRNRDLLSKYNIFYDPKHLPEYDD